jgi:hypothetical protein
MFVVNVRLRLYKQLAVSDLPVAFQQAIMERPLNVMQRQVQALSSLIQVAHACLKYPAQVLRTVQFL